jgi:hypothetical protein
MAARSARVRLWIFARPSLTTQTTIFFHASLPHVLLLVRVFMNSMFLMTPIMVRANSSSSSLYMVMTMNSSVGRGLAKSFWRRVKRSALNSDGSQVAAE